MPPPRCTDPHGIACASQPTRRMKGRKCDVWVCSNCYEIAYPEPAESAEDDPMNIKTRVLAYALYCPGHTVHECADETGINRSSVSSAAATLRNDGMMKPSDGSGRMFLTSAGIEAALKLDIAPPAAPAPTADHQGERSVVATEDTVQTSPLDVANAEIARLQAELATLHTMLDDNGFTSHFPNILREELEGVVRALKTVTAQRDALNRQPLAPAVRLEWGKWSGERVDRVQLWAFTGTIANDIAQIAIDHEICAILWLTSPDGDRTIKVSALEITNENLTKIAGDLSILLAAAGLTMPPVPALPENSA